MEKVLSFIFNSNLMAKFIKKVLIFTALLSCVLFIFKRSVPYYWGNELIADKIEHISDKSFNTLFVGSSTTYRHINPKLFDKKIGQGSNSYNLGSKGMYYLETDYITDNFLKQTSFSGDIFHTYTTPSGINLKNRHAIRHKYFMDFKRLKKGIKYFKKQNDYKEVINHFKVYFENLLCIGELKQIVLFNFRDTKKDKVITKRKGFYSLDHELAESNNKFLKARRAKFKKSKAYKLRKRTYKNDFKVNLIVDENQYPSNRCLFISSNSMDPDFYFDGGHLNFKGAQKFTEELALVYKQIRD